MADAIEQVGPVRFEGHPGDGKNLSAVGVVGGFLLVAGDEGAEVQVLRRDGDHYAMRPGLEIPLNDSGEEADIEGIACEGETVYVVGSHSRTRVKTKAGVGRAENFDRIGTIKPLAPARCILARFRLSDRGVCSDFGATTLRPAILGARVLAPFAEIPCKENGVDIEGLAVRDGLLRVGFRGPVLQHGYVPVLTCAFADPIAGANTLFLNLGGRGIRDLERVDGGFLVLAGPVGEIPASFQLYFWDGGDLLTGAGAPMGRLVPLGDVPTPDGAKAEGLAVEAESKGHYTALVLFDGLKEGGAIRLRVRKPPPGA